MMQPLTIEELCYLVDNTNKMEWLDVQICDLFAKLEAKCKEMNKEQEGAE